MLLQWLTVGELLKFDFIEGGFFNDLYDPKRIPFFFYSISSLLVLPGFCAGLTINFKELGGQRLTRWCLVLILINLTLGVIFYKYGFVIIGYLHLYAMLLPPLSLAAGSLGGLPFRKWKGPTSA